MRRIFTLLTTTLIAGTLFAQAPRTSLLEISESVYTQDNARTICLKETMRSNFGDELAILSYHPDEFQGPMATEDPFFNQASDQWWNIYGTPGFGQGFVDRVSYNGNNLVLGRSLWNDTIAARINRSAIALVTMPEVLYDPATREIFARVQIDFQKESIELKDFRFFLYVAADNQLGIQRFDSLDNSLCGLFIDPNDTNYFLTDTLDSFMHNDVVIANPSTFDGVDDVIPNEVPEGARYTSTFTYTVPNKYAVEDLKVVGFVADYDGNDLGSNAVVNVAKSNSFTEYDSEDPTDPNHPENPENPNSVFNRDYWPTGLNEGHGTSNEIRFFPNPMTDVGVAYFTVPASQMVNVYVTDLEGRTVRSVYTQELMQGEHRAAVSSNGLSAGVYVMQIAGESFTHRVKFILQ